MATLCVEGLAVPFDLCHLRAGALGLTRATTIIVWCGGLVARSLRAESAEGSSFQGLPVGIESSRRNRSFSGGGCPCHALYFSALLGIALFPR
jgi:hypothetical protein